MKVATYTSWDSWVEFEREFNERTGLNCCFIDKDGVRVTAYRKWASALCPAIRREGKGQQTICDRLSDVLADRVPQPESSMVVTNCRAGLLVLCIPFWHRGRFVGLVGGCGLLPREGSVNALAVCDATGLGMKKILSLSQGIGRLLPKEVELFGQYLRRRFEDLRRDMKPIKAKQGGNSS